MQRSASLRLLHLLAPFTGSLTHFAHSLVGQLKFVNMCSRWKRVSWEQSRFLSSVEKRLFSNTFSPRYYVNSLMLCTSYCLSLFFVSSFVLNLHNLVWIHTEYIFCCNCRSWFSGSPFYRRRWAWKNDGDLPEWLWSGNHLGTPNWRPHLSVFWQRIALSSFINICCFRYCIAGNILGIN